MHLKDVKYTDLLKSETCLVVYLLSRNFNDKRAGGEALADVVERLAGVGARVLGKYLRDLEEVTVAAARVDKVLRGLDLLLVVQPDHVVPRVARHHALELDRLAVLRHERGRVLVDPGPDRGRGAAVRLLPAAVGLGRHGEDLDLAGRLDAALGVGGLAGVLSAVLGERLPDGDGPDAVLALDLQDLGGAERLAVLGPRDLRVGVPLHLDPQLEEAAVPHVELGLEAGDEAG